MDCVNVGKTIKELRKAKGLKQRELAEKLNISDKTVSKWERGLGCPDVNILNELADILGTGVENILSGKLFEKTVISGNIAKIKFFICADCGNIINSFGIADIVCCGKKLKEIKPVKADKDQITITRSGGELIAESPRAMAKNDYITFIAFITWDKFCFAKLYPEWNFFARLPDIGHGKLIWCDNKGGAYYTLV